jgi:hypothetical protein
MACNFEVLFLLSAARVLILLYWSNKMDVWFQVTSLISLIDSF